MLCLHLESNRNLCCCLTFQLQLWLLALMSAHLRRLPR